MIVISSHWVASRRPACRQAGKSSDYYKMNKYFIYILSNDNHTVFYTGVTNNLLRRIYEHRNKSVKGFTSRYNITKLLYFEEFDDSLTAIEREKQIKKYSQKKKLNLILKNNQNLNDLYDKIIED
jgi:putative endonuclease